jgi:hypothetical protein
MHGGGLSPVSAEFQQADKGVVRDVGYGGIAGAVVDQNQLQILGGQSGSDFADKVSDVAFLIVEWDD